MKKIFLLMTACFAYSASAQGVCDVVRAANGAFVVVSDGKAISASYSSLSTALDQRNWSVRGGSCKLRNPQTSSCYVAQLPTGEITVARDGKQFTNAVRSVAAGNEDLKALVQSGVCVARAVAAPKREHMREDSPSGGSVNNEGYWVPTPQTLAH